MKKIILTIMLYSIMPVQAVAAMGSAVTEGGHTACVKEQWFDDVMKFIVAGDKASFQAYLDSNKCVILKKGLKVTVTDSPGVFGTRVEFVYSGIKFWTVREALDYQL